MPLKQNRSRIVIDLEGYEQAAEVDEEQLQAERDDEALALYYCSGMCGVLATVLHQLTGWPVYGVYSWHEGHIRTQEECDAFNTPEMVKFMGEKGKFKPINIPPGWGSKPVHVVVRNPVTARFTDATGAEQTWYRITDHYRKLGFRPRIKLMPKVDYFVKDPKDYPGAYAACYLEHLPRLLPGFAEKNQLLTTPAPSCYNSVGQS